MSKAIRDCTRLAEPLFGSALLLIFTAMARPWLVFLGLVFLDMKNER
jgi:hypothetical protein